MQVLILIRSRGEGASPPFHFLRCKANHHQPSSTTKPQPTTVHINFLSSVLLPLCLLQRPSFSLSLGWEFPRFRDSSYSLCLSFSSFSSSDLSESPLHAVITFFGVFLLYLPRVFFPIQFPKTPRTGSIYNLYT